MIAARRPPPPAQRGFVWPHPASLVAFAAGSALAMSFLTSDWGQTITSWAKVALVGVLCTCLWTATGLAGARSRPARSIGRACWLPLGGLYALWAYLAFSFGVLLGWTVPLWLRGAIGLLAAAALATALRPRHRLHVPAVLPLGFWIAAVLSGWLREENLVRCDDVFTLRQPVELIVTNPQVESCRPGEVRPSGRYPRTTWEAPDGERILFTTQGVMALGGFDGSVCEAPLDGSAAPRCVGQPINKAQGLTEVPELDRVLVFQWGVERPGGSVGSVVLELPRRGGIAILAEHWFDEMYGDGFYEPRNSTLYMISDRMNGIHRAILPDFEPAPVVPVDLPTAGELRYDPEAGEGVACGAGIGAAIRGAPFAARSFSEASTAWIDKVSMSWGCDWDQEARKVYSTVPNLGLLDRIDYDSGRVEKRWFVGLGRRSVAYDRERRRVYLTDFLRGEVLAFDERAERTVERWFVGRFSRWVRLTRDGRALLATGNLGVVRIGLDGERRAREAP
jgi:hypothetical protein